MKKIDACIFMNTVIRKYFIEKIDEISLSVLHYALSKTIDEDNDKDLNKRIDGFKIAMIELFSILDSQLTDSLLAIIEIQKKVNEENGKWIFVEDEYKE
jgi:hypothetical protein